MVPSSADSVLQNSRISLSETSTIGIRDVVTGKYNMALHARVSGDQNVTSPVF